MLRTDLTDHRGTDDAGLVHAVADGDAIALAEAYHRTITAAHACARRLLASPVEIEALLRSVYTELWEEPPVDEALEGWVRGRCFTLGSGYLRQQGLTAPSASLAAWTSGIDADTHQGTSDPLERMIAELSDQQQQALIRAHDQGQRTAEQDDPDAGAALQHALLMLASPLTDDERHAAEMCSSGVALANWIFGLLPPHEAATVPGTAAEPTPCGRLAGVLRRARRRFEPLPPTPDLGHRVLAWVLSTSRTGASDGLRASSLDTDLRVASADLDRGNGSPRSSLDMTVPPSSDDLPEPVTTLGGDSSASPAGWARPDSGSDEDRPTAARMPGGPPALAGSSATPIAFGNAAPTLAPHVIEPDDEQDEDLVRMPLRRSRQAPMNDRGDAAITSDDPAETQSIPRRRDDAGNAGDDTVPPPAGLRPAFDRDDTSQRSDTAPSPLGLPAARPLGPDDGSPPQGRDERPPAAIDQDTDSPLRRPAPSPATSDVDTAPHAPVGRRDQDPHQLDPAGERPVAHSDATVQTPIQRDDSDPRVDELFGGGPEAHGDRQSDTVPGGSQAANMTAPTLPAARRGTPPSGASGQPAPPKAAGPTGTSPAQQPAQSNGPRVSIDDAETPGQGNSVLRWLVVVLLIAAGAAVGIFLGQMLI